jgi:hypothetical protein
MLGALLCKVMRTRQTLSGIGRLADTLALHCHDRYLQLEDISLDPAVGLAVAQQCSQSGTINPLAVCGAGGS